MSDMGEMFNALRDARAEKRAANRQSSPEVLRAAGIPFDEKNGGAHLVVEGPNGHIDFWPGTGLWIERGTQRRGRGVRRLAIIASSAKAQTP